MTNHKHGHHRRAIATAVAAVVASGLAVGGAPAPAQASIPKVAQTWSGLMYRSLTASATLAQLRKTLATQQVTVKTTALGVVAATAAETTAKARLATATDGFVEARRRYVQSTAALAEARKALTAATKKKPRSTTAIAKAQKAVDAATKTAAARKELAVTAFGVRKKAGTEATTAAEALSSANAAAQAATAAVGKTQQKIAGVGTAAGYAAQAAQVSKDVVTQVRAGFTVADTTQIYGVTVHSSVSFAFKRMVDDAKQDGIALSGGGFRTKERQIELRKINGCPDIWTAPASSCRVPTAIPGRSLHEIGLAVDITSGGKTIGSDSPAFKWLTVHAKEYGYVNLPSEAWHWSITGG